MEMKHLQALLDLAGTDESDGWQTLKEERTLTLHTASSGVGLNVARIRRVRTEDTLLFAENQNRETFILHLANVFAGSVDSGNASGRKAGFR